MGMSFGEALLKGKPVVLQNKIKPEVICVKGKGDEALELLQELGLIRLLRPEIIKED